MKSDGIFSSLRVSASGLRAQRTRLDVTAENLANMETTRSADGGPYRPKRAVFQVAEQGRASFVSTRGRGPTFRQLLASQRGHMKARSGPGSSPVPGSGISRHVGVRIEEIDTPFIERYEPDHPDADETGIVRLPNVEPVSEMMNLIKATRAYEANATAMDAAKEMLSRSLDI
jgi:flagellar basal-body rod protein FlgC